MGPVGTVVTRSAPGAVAADAAHPTEHCCWRLRGAGPLVRSLSPQLVGRASCVLDHLSFTSL